MGRNPRTICRDEEPEFFQAAEFSLNNKGDECGRFEYGGYRWELDANVNFGGCIDVFPVPQD